MMLCGKVMLAFKVFLGKEGVKLEHFQLVSGWFFCSHSGWASRWLCCVAGVEAIIRLTSY